jgi:hypothetical protein
MVPAFHLCYIVSVEKGKYCEGPFDAIVVFHAITASGSGAHHDASRLCVSVQLGSLIEAGETEKRLEAMGMSRSGHLVPWHRN